MKDDIAAVACLFLGSGIVVFVTLVFCGMAQWVAGVGYRLGLISSQAQWTIYAMALCLCIGLLLLVLSRITEDKWPWL